MLLKLAVTITLLVGCGERSEPEPTQRTSETAKLSSAPTRNAQLAKCEPNHEPELPETFSCLADMNDGFTAYEWVVDHDGTFVVTAGPTPSERLVSPAMKILDDGGETIHKANGASSVELRARISPGRYSVVVMLTNARGVQHLHLAAARTHE